MRNHKISLFIFAILMAFSLSTFAATKTFNVKASQFKFSPSTITVRKNDTVRLILTSKDVTHGLYIKAYKINMRVKKGEKKTIKFVANKTGRFPFVCSVYCGSGHRVMKGMLIVK